MLVRHAGGEDGLVRLCADHPGFHDLVYRRRRNEIARLALAYQAGDPIPDVSYTEEETQVWREVCARLLPLHQQGACQEILAAARAVDLPTERVPQLREVNEVLRRSHGFTMLPVAGLVSEEVFLTYLGQGVFLSTQYMRHHSAPLYTPEPDVIHELIGHAASLAHPDFVRLSRAFGAAVGRAKDEEAVHRLARVYWYTLEFGAVEEGGQIKAYGAGLLSSCGELARFLSGAPLLPLDLDRMAETPYDPTQYQPNFFVAGSFAALVESVLAWLDAYSGTPLR